MSLARLAYGVGTRLLHPALPLILNRRIKAGKDAPDRANERLARDLPPRPEGVLVWLHGASVGESQVQLQMADALRDARPDLSFLFTSQTLTSARIVAKRLPPASLHQMAPFDSPAIARRFVRHWQPDLAVFAESDLWPNLLAQLRREGSKTALINARMSDKSLKNWTGAQKRFGEDVIGKFDVILAANTRTAHGLSRLRASPVPAPGNIKHAAPAPVADDKALMALKAEIGDRPVLAALSTHSGEEALILSAFERLRETHPDLLLLLVPRHPERRNDLVALTGDRTIALRSRNEPVQQETDIFIGDSLGEMGLWFQLARALYLGGGHAPGLGGHNPVEALKHGRFVVSGPDVFNFEEEFRLMASAGAASLPSDPETLFAALQNQLDRPTPIDPENPALHPLLTGGKTALHMTRDALISLLPEARHA